MENYEHCYCSDDEEVLSEQKTEQEDIKGQEEVYWDIVEQDIFDNFLECWYQAQEYYELYFLKTIKPCDVFWYIQTIPVNIKYNKLEDISEGMFYWCNNLLVSACYDETVSVDMINKFYKYIIFLKNGV
jgi:hypothetical protein